MKLLKKKWLQTLLAIVFWIAVWWGISLLVGEKLLVPSPYDTVVRTAELMRTADFYRIVLSSCLRVLLSVVLSAALGLVLGILTGLSGWAKAILMPALSVMRATPVASFIVLFVLFMNRRMVPFAVAVITMLPVIWTNTEEGVRAADPALLELSRVYELSLFRKIRGIYAPSVFPFFLSGVRSSFGMGWKSAVAAEVIAMPLLSIGRSLYYAGNNLDTSGVFSWTLVVVILSVGIEAVLTFFSKRILPVKKEGGNT